MEPILKYSSYGYLRWTVTTLGGNLLPLGQNKVYSLLQLVEQVDALFPRQTNYDKIYRGLKKSNAFAQVLTLSPYGGVEHHQLVVLTVSPTH